MTVATKLEDIVPVYREDIEAVVTDPNDPVLKDFDLDNLSDCSDEGYGAKPPLP